MYLYTVTWSTTERREIRNFPYPSVCKLSGCQRLTVKKRNRNVGQFLAAEVTNPGKDESQQMFTLCDRMDKEGGIGTYSSPNESPDRVKEEERGRMIGQYPKAEVVPFSSPEIEKKEISFATEVAVNGRANLMHNSGGRSRARVFMSAVDVIRLIETVTEIPGKSGENLEQEDDRRFQAKLHKIPLARKRENTLGRNPSKS